ncbi:MAG: hypothetical protein IPI49_27885 [Myxococcales bacterium]|nr:hypothetical protein [Myxococcales bacterium]
MSRLGELLAAAWGRVRNANPTTVLLVAWGLLIFYGFPGQMTQDSYDHLREARARIYSDSHPPIINLVWAFFDYFIPGPFAMLVVQSGLFLAGLYSILQWVFAPRRAAWITAAVFLYPPVGVVMSVIWKDCMMAALLAIGTAALVSPRRSRKLLGLAALCLGTAMRYNAFGATAPLIVLLFEWRPGMPWLRRYALALAVWVLTTLAAFGINKALTDKPMHYWISSLAVYDIVGTYANLDETLPDARLQEELAGTELLIKQDLHATIREVYSTRSFFPILNHPQKTLWNLPINYYDPAPEAQRDAIARALWRTISAYPMAYIKHRLRVTAAVIDLESKHQSGAIIKRAARDLTFMHEQGLATGVSKAQMKLSRKLHWVSWHTPLFVPWVYLALTLLLLPLAWRQRDTMALLLSGLGMESSLLLLAHSVDYRYSHWMVLTTVLAAIFLATRRLRAAQAARHPVAAS